MGRTKQLKDTILGEHLALSVAAHLARAQLLPDPFKVYDGQHIAEMVDAVANALARVATLYVRDDKHAEPQELSFAELDGARVCKGATLLVLRDGTTLANVSIKRSDLRQAVALLRATGIPGFRHPPAPAAKPPARKKAEPAVMDQVAELELLLQPPLLNSQVEKAKALAVAIARDAGHGPVVNLAMWLMTMVLEASREGEVDLDRLSLALAVLRAAAEEASHYPESGASST